MSVGSILNLLNELKRTLCEHSIILFKCEHNIILFNQLNKFSNAPAQI